jgi:acyl-CoA thioesterase
MTRAKSSRVKHSALRSGAGPAARTSARSWNLAELSRRLNKSAPGRLFGYVLEELGDGTARMTMPVHARHKQIHGVVHGGILASLADTAGAMAAYPLVPRGTRLATVEMNINYLEPVDRGPIQARSAVLRLGRTLVVSECEIFTAEGNLAAKALLTFAIIPPNRNDFKNQAARQK